MTDIVDALADQDDESLIEPGQMVVTITRDGFIKRTPLETFRAQNRGGRGRSGAVDARRRHRHPQLQCAYASMGAVLLLRRQGVPREGVAPAGSRPDRARAARWSTCCRNSARDTITTVLPLPQDETLWDSLHLVFATASGNVRRNRLSDFRNVRAAGLIAMKLDEGDRLIGVATCREGDDVLLATRKGRCIRFQMTDDTRARVRRPRQLRRARHPAGWTRDEVISLSVLRHVEATQRRARRLSASWPMPGGAATATAKTRPEPAAPTPRRSVAEVHADATSASPSWKRRRNSC